MVGETTIASFPRGKITPEETSKNKDKRANDGGKEASKQSKGRDASKSSSSSTKKRRSLSSSGSTGPRERDFLFGGNHAKTTLNDTAKSKNDIDGSSNKRSKKNNDSFLDTFNASTYASASSKSFLPIGGGGCIIPMASDGGSMKKEGLIETLAFSKLSKGFKLLGICREVHDDVAIFSLPNMWTGYMILSKESTIPLHDMISLHQMMSVTIVKAITETSPEGPKRRIQVTCQPDVCNHSGTDLHNTPNLSVRGQIISVEDHGLLVDLGFHRKGFLAFTDIEGSYELEPKDDDEIENQNNINEDDLIDHPTAMAQPRILSIHRIMDFIVKQKTEAKIVPLKLPAIEKIAEIQSITPTYKPSIHELEPGMLVQCLVEMTVKNGICVTFGGGTYRGSIEIAHFDKYWLQPSVTKIGKESSDSWKKYYMEGGRSFSARIIAVDPVTKIIRLSIQPHLVSMQIPSCDDDDDDDLSSSHFPKSGSIVSGCSVIRVDGGTGVLLSIPDTNENDCDDERMDDDDDDDDQKGEKKLKDLNSISVAATRAVYVHISKAIDDKNEDGKASESVFHKKFTPGSQHTVRILSTASNLIENVATGATALSIINAHVLSHTDVLPGTVYRQVRVCKHFPETGSVLVDFGVGIKGLIHPFHMFDHGTSTTGATAGSNKSNSNRNDFLSKVGKIKYAIGAKVDVRVLYVDKVSKKCYVTAKKPLVKADKDIVVTSYDTLKLGQKAIGYVSKIDPLGIWLTFFNRVYGRVPARSLLSELGIEKPSDNYSIGDVVECRIVNIKKRLIKGRLSRSTISEEEEKEEGDGENQMHIDTHHEDDDELTENDSMTASSSSQKSGETFRRLTLSLKVDGPTDLLVGSSSDGVKSNSSAASATASEYTDVSTKRLHLQTGTIVPPKSMRVIEFVKGRQKNVDSKNGGGTSFIPGYAIVSIKAKYIFPETTNNNAKIDCKLPFDHLLDEYDPEWVSSALALDEFASKALTVGKKITANGLVLVDPKKSSSEYISGTGRLVNVSVRPMFVQYAEKQQNANKSDNSKMIILPGPNTRFFVGAQVVGYVNQVHTRFGSFVRFLNGMSGLVPKYQGGHSLELFRTMIFEVFAIDDNCIPPKISLIPSRLNSSPKEVSDAPGDSSKCPLQVGTTIPEAVIVQIDSNRAMLKIMKTDLVRSGHKSLKVQLHCTLAQAGIHSKDPNGSETAKSSIKNVSNKHPFVGLVAGSKLKNLRVVHVAKTGKTWTVDVTNFKTDAEIEELKINFTTKPEFGDQVSGIVSKVSPSGLCISINPSINGFIPLLEVSEDISVLENLNEHFSLGSRVTGSVFDSSLCNEIRSKYAHFVSKKIKRHNDIKLSMISDGKLKISKPSPGDLVIGCVSTTLNVSSPPAVMLELRNGYVGRCCATELQDVDSWTSMPMDQWMNSHDDDDSECEEEDEQNEKSIEEKISRKRRSNEKKGKTRYVSYSSSYLSKSACGTIDSIFLYNCEVPCFKAGCAKIKFDFCVD
jgi:predicted RNA-binding protein with RPS1 domain